MNGNKVSIILRTKIFQQDYLGEDTNRAIAPAKHAASIKPGLRIDENL
jgi:hypothetical protein